MLQFLLLFVWFSDKKYDKINIYYISGGIKMSILNTFVTDIKNRKSFKELDKRKIVTDEYTNSEYPHLTFKVNNVAEYIEIVKILSQVKAEDFVNGEIIYRGMADKDWKLLPNLGRYKDLSNGQEYNLVHNLLSFRPEAFINLNSNFEILSKMQHYELPTRLLDFTTNPLIALFFACNDLINDKDARIVCHRACIDISNNEMIETVCGFHNYSIQHDIRLDDLNIPPLKYIRRLYRQKDARILVARPMYWNERIQRQRAIFMIFPNRLFDQYGLWAYGGRIDYEQHWNNNKNYTSLEMTEKEPLKKMYKFADQRDFYITHSSVSKMFEFYEDDDTRKQALIEWKEPFRNRFSFRSEIEPIEPNTLKKEFCSVIIDKKEKKNILNELRTLGIDEAFVYPELQYTAKKLKNIYLD